MQSTNTVIMVQPSCFGFNPITAADNTFQHLPENLKEPKLAQEKALNEFCNAVNVLKDSGVNVMVIKDELDAMTTDSIFPNNWFSTHANGSLCLYPMMAANRRLERQMGIIEALNTHFQIKETLDFTSFEVEDKFLEGTGSLVFDREHKIAYASVSERTHVEVLDEVLKKLDYKPVIFQALDENKNPIYHTNVLMSVTKHFMIICLECIKDKTEQAQIIAMAKTTGKTIIEISFEQLTHFCGNVLELKSQDNTLILTMSTNAFNYFTSQQIKIIEEKNKIVHIPLPTIETLGGGGMRCMIAEVFLKTNKRLV